MKLSPDPARQGGLALAGRAPDVRSANDRAASRACAVLAICLGVAGGCQVAEQPSAEVVRLNVLESPCAVRMGGICEALLLYYAANGKLPAALADLSATRGPHAPPLVCPRSRKPYVYNPSGLTIPRLPGKLVLYDPEPSHSGMRLGILLEPRASGSVPTARPIVVSETEFAAARGPDERPREPQKR